MGTPSYIVNAVYEAAWKEEWDGMSSAFEGKNNMYVMAPVTVSEDTPLHLAVYGQGSNPLKRLLDIVNENPQLGNPLKKENAYGNTVLHEAAAAGNMEAVKHLLPKPDPENQREFDPSGQHKATNKLGETPLYRAASRGKKEIVKYLAELPEQISCGKLLKVHCERKDSKPILHAAIQGQHFETALTLLELDPSLYQMQDDQGMTCLHLLADMPSAFKSGYGLRKYSIWNLIYCYLSVANGGDDQSRSEKGCPMVERIRKEKYKHESALKLAHYLIEKNKCCWWQSITVDSTQVKIETPGQGGRQGWGGNPGEGGRGGGGEGKGVGAQGVDPGDGGERGVGGEQVRARGVDAGKGGGRGEVENNENAQPKIEENIQKKPPNPLFIATSNGIVEIAKEILRQFPQGIELVNDEGQNILHVAVMHRQREIFRLVKEKSIPMARLSSKIDNKGYTLLHQVAHTKHYRGGTRPGPALKLQDEIKWFKRVERVVPSSLSEQRVPRPVPSDKEYKLTAHVLLQMEPSVQLVIPPYHALQRDKDYKLTAYELFQEEHKDQLKLAQDWVEKTSQSCSAVAVLLATVVFAAAYTIPGGSDDHGFPIFLHNPFFLAFTVLDAIALASSLTSVVMFLSILTTPFDCEKFYCNIPRKLIWGFTLLFFSVMTTMLAFACTLFLIIHFKKKWTTGLISVAAFLPVTVFALMQFPLYVSFLSTVKDFFKEARKSLPSFCCLFRCQCCWKGKTRRRKWAF